MTAAPLYTPRWISLSDIAQLINEARLCGHLAAQTAVCQALIDDGLHDGPGDRFMTAGDWQDLLTSHAHPRPIDFDSGRVTLLNGKLFWPRYDRRQVVSVFELERPAPAALIGRPAYSTPQLNLMYEAIAALGISEANQPKAEELRQWFEARGVSNNIATAMVTIIRSPKLSRGGQRKIS
jgi:hypothetical protein